MRSLKTIFILLFAMCAFQTYAQLSGVRVAVSSNIFVDELGTSDVPHPTALALSSATSSDKFKNEMGIGAEVEILFDITNNSKIGIETEYVQLKGSNDDPPYYNYFLTPYFANYQTGYLGGGPVAYNTSLINVTVNWKYFPFTEPQLKPFIKFGGVVSFVATDFTINDPVVPSPDNILYARGTSNSDQGFWPAFHLAAGAGFTYDMNDRWALQADATANAIFSDIINGSPNFSFEVDNNLLKHNRQPALVAQVSFGVIYKIDPSKGQSGPKGRTDKNLPFFRKK